MHAPVGHELAANLTQHGRQSLHIQHGLGLRYLLTCASAPYRRLHPAGSHNGPRLSAAPSPPTNRMLLICAALLRVGPSPHILPIAHRPPWYLVRDAVCTSLQEQGRRPVHDVDGCARLAALRCSAHRQGRPPAAARYVVYALLALIRCAAPRLTTVQCRGGGGYRSQAILSDPPLPF